MNEDSWSTGRFRFYIHQSGVRNTTGIQVLSELKNNHMGAGSNCEWVTNVFENI